MSFQELALLFVIGLLVLGPERLPKVASQVGRWVGAARRTANQLRYQLEREIALADVAKPGTTPVSEPRQPSPEAPSGSGSESSAESKPGPREHGQ